MLVGHRRLQSISLISPEMACVLSIFVYFDVGAVALVDAGWAAVQCIERNGVKLAPPNPTKDPHANPV